MQFFLKTKRFPFSKINCLSNCSQWRPYMGAKGAFAPPPVFIFLFQPKAFHCLLENLTKKTHYLLWVFKNLPLLNFKLSPLLIVRFFFPNF